MNTENLRLAELRACADALIAVFEDEERALAAYAPATEMNAITRAKTLRADKFCHAIEAMRGTVREPREARAAADVLTRFQDSAERNELAVSRRLEVLRGVLGAIEEANARHTHCRVNRYTRDGGMSSAGFAPVVVDSRV